MNFSRYDLTHFKICLHSIIVMAVAAICFSSQAQADGVILIKSHATQSPQFWRAFAFSINEASSYNYNVTLLNGQQQNFFRTQVGAIFEEPKWSELIITSDADWQKLEQQKSKFLDSLGQFPQLKNWSDSLAAKFDNLLDKNSSSVVVYKGRIISRDDYNKLRGQASSSNSGKLEKGVLAELTIGSVKLTNVKLKSFNETRVSLVHSNGIQGYNVADLKEAEISSLGKAFPEFAEHMKKHEVENSTKLSDSKMISESDKPKTTSPLETPVSGADSQDKLLTNSLGMKFVHVPQTQIMICIHETRVKDYSKYLQSRRGNLQGIKNADATPELPITEVSYDDATDFCKWLTSKEGRNYRLPTDEEWSTAVGLPPESGKNPKEKSEKGDLEIYPWGNYYPPNKQDGNFGLTQTGRDTSFTYADDGYEDTAPVMSFKPNKFGIFDMGGNVREWCLDWFDEKQDTRVTRGTSFFYLYSQEDHRSSLRFGQKPENHDTLHGFRCVIGSLTKENDQSKHSVISDAATARMSDQIRDGSDSNNTAAWFEFEKQWLFYDKKLTENARQFFNVSNKLDELNSFSNSGKVSKNEELKLRIEQQRLFDEQTEILLINDKLREEAKRIDPTGEKFKKLLRSLQ